MVTMSMLCLFTKSVSSLILFERVLMLNCIILSALLFNFELMGCSVIVGVLVCFG